MQVWILTFDRPKALNKQINLFGSLGYEVCVFSNHPTVTVYEDNKQYVKDIVINTLSDENSHAYMARSWNNIWIKCFKYHDEIMCVQDDADVNENIKDIIENNKNNYDLIWGPKGDTFYYIKKELVKKIGWWDERFLGAYCSDADFLLRCWIYYDRNKLSIDENHDWGWIHNSVEIQKAVSVEQIGNTLDNTYVNQHAEIIKTHGHFSNYLIDHSQGFFRYKWGTPGNGLNMIGCLLDHISVPLVNEIDWYPWFTKKFFQIDCLSRPNYQLYI